MILKGERIPACKDKRKRKRHKAACCHRSLGSEIKFHFTRSLDNKNAGMTMNVRYCSPTAELALSDVVYDKSYSIFSIFAVISFSALSSGIYWMRIFSFISNLSDARTSSTWAMLCPPQPYDPNARPVLFFGASPFR